MAIEKRTIKVISNCYLKYDSDIYEANEEFKIRKSDKEAMELRGFITVKTKEKEDNDLDEEAGETE
ncbi:MAG: hypothetical protein ACRCX2_14300 [Paraclostridium sp.]